MHYQYNLMSKLHTSPIKPLFRPLLSILSKLKPSQHPKSPTMASKQTLTRFQTALQTLYGPLPAPNPSTWVPPLSSGGHRGRYLWTDAFGVLNFITLSRELRDNTYLTLASRLIDCVHNTLGYTRDGKSRLPRASDTNPLAGGLRIGKVDESGSDGDGQYHHYLTVWMFALNRMSLACDEAKYNDLAIELAKAIHPRFLLSRGSERIRMVWKMDVDLEKALVGSEGNLDPIDGFVVFRLLQAAAVHFGGGDGDGDGSAGQVLKEEIQDYARVMERKGEHFVTSDPLDLGMTMWTVQWVLKEEWAAKLAERCFEQLYDLFEKSHYLARSMKYRLAFREFGTTLGVKCMAEQDSKDRSVDLKVYADRILESWEPHMEQSQGQTPEDLKPITRVMYAAALIPGGVSIIPNADGEC
ncbi:hypothetical protein BJX70DRAFT_227229 [Aspergillus crustosus]